VTWLKNGNGGYWISGKPGSGKSTLLKYIYMNCPEWVLPPDSDPERSQVYTGFFFHEQGSHFQKSFEGLLHSILHQILVSDDRLVLEIMPFYLRQKEPGKRPWQLLDLIDAFFQLLVQDTVSVDIYLFLDAVDECEGPPEAIADFIQAITTRTDRHAAEVKICFSSRPSNTFIDRFGKYQRLKIHERTAQDIQKYLTTRLADNPSTTVMLASEDPLVKLAVWNPISDIIERVEGVFLWLGLVMDDLVRAHAEGASLMELSRRLSLFLDDLEKLHCNVIQNIPADLRRESFYMLEIVSRSDGGLSILDFISCLICAPCETLEQCVAGLKAENTIPPSADTVRRRLKNRCGCLIGLMESEDEPLVQFMHEGFRHSSWISEAYPSEG
jgi:hypothetical protein